MARIRLFDLEELPASVGIGKVDAHRSPVAYLTG